MSELTDAKIANYQFEISIKRSASDIWSLLTDDIDAWWMNDFRALGEDSKMTLNTEPGGQLLEASADGSCLEWYRVQLVSPGKWIYFVGYMAPDWGGPTTSMLKLEIDQHEDGGLLIVSDALLGNVTEASAVVAQDGWKMLFTDGLKKFSEKS